jgi:hypothetical protein
MKQDWVQFNNKPKPHGAKPFPPTRLKAVAVAIRMEHRDE